MSTDPIMAAEMAAAREAAFAKASAGMSSTQLNTVWDKCECGHGVMQPVPRGPIVPKAFSLVTLRCTACGVERRPVFTRQPFARSQTFGASQDDMRQERMMRRVTTGAWDK